MFDNSFYIFMIKGEYYKRCGLGFFGLRHRSDVVLKEDLTVYKVHPKFESNLKSILNEVKKINFNDILYIEDSSPKGLQKFFADINDRYLRRKKCFIYTS